MGPVFVYEWMTAARRWQMYALRALFVAVLLFVITLVWAKNVQPATWFGGLDLEALIGAYAVTAGMAIFGCALTLLLSVWGRKTHEVLIAAYLIEVLILLAYPAALIIEGEVLKVPRSVISDVMVWTN